MGTVQLLKKTTIKIEKVALPNIKYLSRASYVKKKSFKNVKFSTESVKISPIALTFVFEFLRVTSVES